MADNFTSSSSSSMPANAYSPLSLVKPYLTSSIARLFSLLSTYTPLLILLFSYIIYLDYLAFKSLGPGGTPSTPLGYVRIKFLSLFAIREPYTPAIVPPHFRPQAGYLSSLPIRNGPRPVVLGIAPQRQQNQRPSSEVFAALCETLRGMTRVPKNRLVEGTSCFEKHGSGLFSLAPITRTCRGEICHAHPSDGSLHMTLHPADAKTLLEAKWGERHPLARGGWFRRFVPREFVLVYAPRTEEEIAVVEEIVKAAVWWISGVDMGDKTDGLEDPMQHMSKDDSWDCQANSCKVSQVAGIMQS